MKALTLTQPWATLVALGHKRVETRSWRHHFLGTIAIHAAKGFPKQAREFAEMEHSIGRIPGPIPLSAIVAVARLAGYGQTEEVEPTVSGLERHLGDFSWGRWAWFLEDVRALPEPIPCRGALGLWTVPDEIAERLLAQVRGQKRFTIDPREF